MLRVAVGKPGLPQGSEGGAARQKLVENGKSVKPSRSRQVPIRCPQCTSQRVWRDGVRRTKHGDVQRWLCRDCGLRFSESTADLKVKVNVSSQGFEQPNPGKNLLQANVFQSEFSPEPSSENLPLKCRENVASHAPSRQTITEKSIYTFADYNRERRVRAEEDEAKNLAKAESRIERRAAGATTTQSTKADIKGKIIEFAWKLKNEGYREATIKAYTCALVTLTNKGANVLDPESVKETIAKQEQWTETSKFNYATFYDAFTKIMGIKWKNQNTDLANPFLSYRLKAKSTS